MTALPVLVICGPTASGKTRLAVELARRCGGEVISADAFAVYQGMDIGTAKPTAAERGEVPHHLIDVFPPEERCDAQRWFTLADAALRDICARGKLPIVAGGTPLYAKALLEGLSAGAPRDPAMRAALQERYVREGAAALFAELQRVDPVYATGRHPNDERRVVRALEVFALTGQPYSSFHTTDGVRRSDLCPLLIGLDWPRDQLYARIDQRVERMFAAGLVDEVRALKDRLSPEARQGVGYKEVIAWLDGHGDEAEARRLVARNSRHLAKHQMTWYRGWQDIVWLPGAGQDLVAQAAQRVDALLCP
jgi:tRNA dimethylallyltransferase